MRILIVEDDQRLRDSLRRGLEDELHTVDVVADGFEALDYTGIILDGTYDAIVLDVMLPGCDGVTVCRRWRQEGVSTPILMLTAMREVEDRVQGLDAGADDYLTKPFAFVELLARVRALGRREPAVRSEVLQVEDLILDPATHRVERAGTPLELTPREHRILELFMRNQGQVLTRDQIADRAWELGADHASNVVDVFIHTLRRKIDGPYPVKLLQTVRGMGYVMRPSGSGVRAGHPTAV